MAMGCRSKVLASWIVSGVVFVVIFLLMSPEYTNNVYSRRNVRLGIAGKAVHVSDDDGSKLFSKYKGPYPLRYLHIPQSAERALGLYYIRQYVPYQRKCSARLIQLKMVS